MNLQMMKVCVGSAFPGGVEGEIVFQFEDSELFDYYESDESGRFVHTAQIRRCLCSDLIEAVVRRGIDAVVVKDLSSTSLFKFAGWGVKIFVTQDRSVRASLQSLHRGELTELTIRDMAAHARKRKQEV
jgi:predicted Fe-Mo cluster-binding NifX family protein